MNISTIAYIILIIGNGLGWFLDEEYNHSLACRINLTAIFLTVVLSVAYIVMHIL